MSKLAGVMGRRPIANVAMVMAMVLMMSMQVAEAAQKLECLNVQGGSAPYADATTLVQRLRVKTGQCCNNNDGTCKVVLTAGNSAATICGPFDYCVSCSSMGNALNLVLSQCNNQNKVQGAYSPDGSGYKLLYITSASSHP